MTKTRMTYTAEFRASKPSVWSPIGASPSPRSPAGSASARAGCTTGAKRSAPYPRPGSRPLFESAAFSARLRTGGGLVGERIGVL
jgi:hypothetical protein